MRTPKITITSPDLAGKLGRRNAVENARDYLSIHFELALIDAQELSDVSDEAFEFVLVVLFVSVTFEAKVVASRELSNVEAVVEVVVEVLF